MNLTDKQKKQLQRTLLAAVRGHMEFHRDACDLLGAIKETQEENKCPKHLAFLSLLAAKHMVYNNIATLLEFYENLEEDTVWDDILNEEAKTALDNVYEQARTIATSCENDISKIYETLKKEINAIN